MEIKHLEKKKLLLAERVGTAIKRIFISIVNWTLVGGVLIC